MFDGTYWKYNRLAPVVQHLAAFLRGWWLLMSALSPSPA